MKNNQPTTEWLKLYNEKKSNLQSQSDLNLYFSADEICGKRLFHLDLGNYSFPTGEILVRDPLVYLTKEENPYFISIPTGVFPITVLVVQFEEDHYRYVGFRLKTKDTKAVLYTEALLGNEELQDVEEGEYFGFSVDAGLATIVDVATRDAYAAFEQEWQKNHPDGNIYDDYFAALFSQSYQDKPDFQREGGDWIRFDIPNTNLSIPMIQSGFGDGVYPVYFGFDDHNEICEVVVQFIDIELTMEADEEEED
ncbi:DUF4241 domain-containing protein [Empedobacter brevis]|uniref:DUF4241 domain-containing protein n=1 Tax=Empedobacter brevis TaxID=247 RepID=UPI0028988EAC|nr:DUF4241 domain-containing protein [Empedobacter brevis]